MSPHPLAAAWVVLLRGHGAGENEVARAGARLLDRWTQPHRRYHDLTHLRAVLTHVEALADHAADPDAVRLAAWFHDAVHEGRPGADEADSATLAELELGPGGLGLDADLVAEVARLVRLTDGHDPGPGDRNGETLCDADLAVLAGAPSGYDAYARAVRAEYAHLDEQTFRAGRAAVLRKLLEASTLFRTPHGRAHWETPARENLTRELRALTAPTGSRSRRRGGAADAGRPR